jgi:hypothetical protein
MIFADFIYRFCIQIKIMMAYDISYALHFFPLNLWILGEKGIIKDVKSLADLIGSNLFRTVWVA